MHSAACSALHVVGKNALPVVEHTTHRALPPAAVGDGSVIGLFVAAHFTPPVGGRSLLSPFPSNFEEACDRGPRAHSLHLFCFVVVKVQLGKNQGSGYSILAVTLSMIASWFVGASPVQAYVIKKTKTGHAVRWSAPVVTLSVDPQLEDFFGKDVVHASLTIATDAWRGMSNVPDVVISDKPAPGYQSSSRTNGIYLMNPWPFAKEQLAVTVSTYDLDGKMIGADILVNGESDYAFLPDGDDIPGMTHHDIAAVLTHEMGHVLGLDESPDEPTATMYPYIRGGEVHQRTLEEDDHLGIEAAYKGVTFDSASKAGCTQASVLGARPSDSTMQWSALMIAAVWLGRRSVSRRVARRAN